MALNITCIYFWQMAFLTLFKWSFEIGCHGRIFISIISKDYLLY